jgi:hypothetical protein
MFAGSDEAIDDRMYNKRRPPVFSFLADLVLVTHLAFAVFVALGGLLALRWSFVRWIHLPAAVWGAAIEFGGWICPLTPLENWLRVRAGRTAYEGDFVARYVLPVLYPEGLARDAQLVLGLLVVVINAAVYWVVFRRASRSASISF